MIRSNRVWGIAFILILLGGASLLWWNTLNRQRVQKTEDEEEELGGVVRIGVTIANDEEWEKYAPIIELAEEDIVTFSEERGSPFSFEFVVRNCESQAQVALDLTKEFHENGTDLIVGHPWSSMMCGGVQRYINESDMLLLSPSSTSPLWCIPGDNMFRLSCHDPMQGSIIAEMLHNRHVKAIVIVGRDNYECRVVCDEIEARYAALGGIVVGRVLYDPFVVIEPPQKKNDPSQVYPLYLVREDYHPFLLDAEALLNESIEEYGIEHVAVEFVANFGAMNITVQALDFPTLPTVPWYGSDGTFDVFNRLHWTEEVEGARESFARLGLVGPIASPSYSPEYRKLNERYHNVTGLQLDFTGSNYYDGCWLYALSVIRANSTDVNLVRDALRELARDYVGMSGPCELDENDDRLRGHYDLMGYFEVEGETQYLKCGFYNATTGEITWNEELAPSSRGEDG